MGAVQIAPKTQKLKYNPFAPNNRRNDAQAAFLRFVESGRDVRELSRWMCDDDIYAVIEMLCEEKRKVQTPQYKTHFEDAQIIEA